MMLLLLLLVRIKDYYLMPYPVSVAMPWPAMPSLVLASRFPDTGEAGK